MNDSIILSLLSSDLKRNKAIHITLFIFLLLSALLMTSGALVIERLNGALDQVMATAKPPHVLQMHIGDYSTKQIEQFAKRTRLVETLQIQEMANVEGVNLNFKRADGSTVSLGDSLLDNYFVKQNSNFDYLLDTENHIIAMQVGHVGVPISYARTKSIAVGDQLQLTANGYTANYIVSHLIRDAQMGSSLSSSIRFLLHQDDFAALYQLAPNKEVLIEFRLTDEATIDHFVTLYNDPTNALPSNGVQITYPLIKLVNGIADGLMSGVIILVGVVLLTIATITMRFTILATLERDVREIGALKAIGIKHVDIANLYKLKYRFLTLIVCLIVVPGTFVINGLFTANIALNFGQSAYSMWTFLVPLIALISFIVIIEWSLHRILRRIAKMSVVEALIDGRLNVNQRTKKSYQAANFKWLFNQIDLSLSWHDIKHNYKSWLAITLLFILSSFTMLVPYNLYATMSSSDFVRYVGAAKSDVRMSIQYRDNLVQTVKNINRQLAADDDIKTYHHFKKVRGTLIGKDKSKAFVVEVGDYKTFDVAMSSGRLPSKDGEIALSSLNQAALECQLGDELTIQFNGISHSFTVVGSYQDITNGGITAKISQAVTGTIIEDAFFIDLKDGVIIDHFVERLEKQYPDSKVIAVDTLIDQTLGTITSSLDVVVKMVYLLVVLIIGMLAVLFTSLQIAKKEGEDGALLALGFKKNQLRVMYLQRMMLAVIIGTSCGVLLSLTLGQLLIGVIVSLMGFGITQLSFLVNPLWLLLVGCTVPVLIAATLTWQMTRRITNNIVNQSI